MDFECDFVVSHDDAGLSAEEIRVFSARDLAEAIQLVEEMLKDEPELSHNANVIHIRTGKRIIWARAL